ncbi:MAG: phosphopantothenoylcysteine decarboxylase [Oscillospiraceae bacterium]|nr:phosphopantothenoylcysteine decarboxylase [Oscillospiraceae bacterium]
MKTIILGVTGSIAAYKAADIAGGLVKLGCGVHVVMTLAGASFITPLTMQALTKNRVYTDVLQEDDPSRIVHVELPQAADAFVVAPATANIIGKLACGIADDMLTSMALAAYDIPMLIAPAMNTRMYQNAVTRENLQRLTARGWTLIEPREARLACGYFGKGALARADDIIKAVADAAGVLTAQPPA